jgi:RNA polymerase-associated protein CTR9
MHIQPSDRAILYNIAMIQQKGAEIMLALDPARRTLDELQLALKNAQESVNTFRALADDKSGPLPYDAEIANQRSRYGENLLQNQGPKQVALQETYEGDYAARVEVARKARAEEQARIEGAAAERQAKIDARAAELAEERRKARDEAREWQEQMAQQLADEEIRKAERLEQRKRKKDASDIVNDEEEEGDDDRPRRKKKSSKKSRKQKSPTSDDEMDDGPDEDADPDAARRSRLEKLKASVSARVWVELTMRRRRRRHRGTPTPTRATRAPVSAERRSSLRRSLRTRTRRRRMCPWMRQAAMRAMRAMTTPPTARLKARLRASPLRRLRLVLPRRRVPRRLLVVGMSRIRHSERAEGAR